jgi:phosphoribosylanthranilate isomerase
VKKVVRVKICGITNSEDATKAVELGADALGFIFAPSPRRIRPEEAGGIIAALPPFVISVGVFVNEKPAVIKKVAETCDLGLIQLHGDESAAMCAELMPRSIKAFRIKNVHSLGGIERYLGSVKALLFDTHSEKMRGGTGKTFDWSVATEGKKLGVPLILSGGLNPANIAEAITTVRPYAVDVNSGIEERPGKKDHRLMRALMETIRAS